MWRERMKSYAVIEYKWIVLAKSAICALMLVSSALLFSFVRKPAASVEPHVIASHEEVSGDSRMKRAVVSWMKEHSKASETVLSAIYDQAVATRYPDLVLAICFVESNFNPGVRSHKGAVGLMGVVPSVWQKQLKEEGIIQDPKDLFLISKNIESGFYVLRHYLRKSGDLEEALLEYVGGDLRYAGKVMTALREIYRVKILN